MWTIYGKNGVEKAQINKLEYSGAFLSKCYVTFTINSHSPINFENEDYLDYRGERFTLRYIPAKKKKAEKLRYGEAFVYENIKFNSLSDELTRCGFFDIVLEDNKIHFTSLPTFSFYASSVKDLADRIQANLDRMYTGDKKWTVTVASGTVSKDISMSFSKVKCWDALTKVYDEFGLNFIIRGRSITIGGKGSTIAHEFEYGEDSGLTSIEQTTNEENDIITRLRAYGSTKNMPYRYYNKLPNVSESMYLPNLMLPGFRLNGKDSYIDSSVGISKYGINEGTVFFDGSDTDLAEIYPTIEGMTAAQLISGGVSVSVDSGDNGNLDEIVSSDQMTDSGILPETGDLNPSTFSMTIKDVGFNIKDAVSSDTPQIVMRSGECVGRTFDINSCSKVGNKYVLIVTRYSDTSLNIAYPNKDYQLSSGDEFSVVGIELPDVYVIAAEQKLEVEAIKYLALNDHTTYTYKPNINNVFMARHPELYSTIKEGDVFVFRDTDLGIEDAVTISNLSIKEGEELIPNYDITLNEELDSSFVDRVTQQVNQVMSSNGSTISRSEVLTLIRLIGGNSFLSKTNDDIASGLISFIKGIIVTGGITSDTFSTKGFVSGTSGAKIDEDGNADIQNISSKSVKARELSEFSAGVNVTGESEFKDRTTFRKGLTAYSTSTEGAGNGIIEGEESEILEVDASEFSTTIGGLENVSDAADNASAGSILSYDGTQWAVIASQSDTATDIANMLVPVWHTVLQKMIFVPCSIFGSGQVVTNNKFPYTLPLILS